MKNVHLPLLLMIGAAITIFTSCEKEDSDDAENTPQTFYGPSVNLGNGTASTYLTEDANGDPLTLGVVLSASALENLPEEMQAFVLDFPDEISTQFYTHVMLDWNPQGHEPPGVYDIPHFDLHFYIIPNEERMAIGPEPVEKFAHAPDAMYVPEDYFQTEGGVPQMGAHWLDAMAPELSGEVFTNTFIWGSYDGEFIFWEPMITRDYLLSNPDEVISIKQPSEYQKDGWYATKYKVSYSATDEEYSIALTELKFHNGAMMK
jgi:hypothetical protein